jgi:hypothetical protein
MLISVDLKFFSLLRIHADISSPPIQCVTPPCLATSSHYYCPLSDPLICNVQQSPVELFYRRLLRPQHYALTHSAAQLRSAFSLFLVILMLSSLMSDNIPVLSVKA